MKTAVTWSLAPCAWGGGYPGNARGGMREGGAGGALCSATPVAYLEGVEGDAPGHWGWEYSPYF
jgi:hypothetical protein|eukprot:COSAG01_NODE_5840_length_4002_cov_4.630797_5_plen_64_part_00